MEFRDIPRLALLTASEAAYNRQFPEKPATSRWLAPLVPRTAVQARLLRKAGKRRNKMAQASRSPPAGNNPFREAPRAVPKAAIMIRNGCVPVKHWDSKMGAPTLNLPAYNFRVTTQDESTIITTSHIGERVVFRAVTGGSATADPETVSDCGQYVIGF